MQKLSSLLGRLAVVAAGALALGACNRAEYAMLPRSASYLGTKTVASTPRPAAPVAAHPEAAPVAPAAEEMAAAPVAASVAETPAAPVAAMAAPAVKPAVAVRSEPAPATPVATASTPAPAKLNLVQRLALHKITKKLEKLTAKAPQFKQRDAAASTSRIDGNLRSAVLFGLIGLIVLLFSGISNVFVVVGTILLIIGLIFLVLWLLDQA